MYIGIDLGTSSVKTILFNYNQEILTSAYSELTIQNPKDGFNEQNPSEWLTAVEKCFDEIQNKKPKEFTETVSIGISGQMHGATLIDKSGGVIRPCILWNDTRSFLECQEFEEQDFDVRSISGNITMPGFTAPKINWLKKNEIDNFKKINKILLPKDYLRFYLTHEYFSEMSDASGTSWLDIRNRKWSEKLLGASSICIDNMPKLVEGNEETGFLTNTLKSKYHFKNNVIVVGGAGDNAAAAVGMGIIKENQSFISLGTSGVFFTPTSNYLSNTKQAVHSFCHCLPKKWHLMSVMLSASNCLDWVCSLTNTSINKALINSEKFSKESLELSNAPFFLPYMSGERTPHNDSYIRGSFHFLKISTSNAALQYSVIEGISFGILDGFNSIKSVNKNFKDILIVGGGSKSSFWLSLLASILKCKLSVSEQSELSAAIGAARLAMFVDKNISDKNSIINKMKIKKEFQPNDKKIEILSKRYKIWQNIYKDNKSLAPSFFNL